MNPEEIVEYVRTEIDYGTPEHVVRERLLAQGVDERQVDVIIQSISQTMQSHTTFEPDPNQELLTYIQRELERGVPNEVIRAALTQNGWDTEVVNRELERATRPYSLFRDIWFLLPAGLFFISIVGMLEGGGGGYLTFAWFIGLGLSPLVVLGYLLSSIIRGFTKRPKSLRHFNRAIILLLLFLLIGAGTGLVNLSYINLGIGT